MQNISTPAIVISIKPTDLESVLSEEFTQKAAKLVELHTAAPDLLKQLESLLFIAESVAHLKGLEREILPTTERIRDYIEQFR